MGERNVLATRGHRWGHIQLFSRCERGGRGTLSAPDQVPTYIMSDLRAAVFQLHISIADSLLTNTG